MLDWSEEEMIEYLKNKNLPLNKLYYEGYESVGCYPLALKKGNDETEDRKERRLNVGCMLKNKTVFIFIFYGL